MFSDSQINVAVRNIEAQEALLDVLKEASLSYDFVANEHDFTKEEMESMLSGETDLTIGQLRHLANALDVTISYSVTLPNVGNNPEEPQENH